MCVRGSVEEERGQREGRAASVHNWVSLLRYKTRPWREKSGAHGCVPVPSGPSGDMFSIASLVAAPDDRQLVNPTVINQEEGTEEPMSIRLHFEGRVGRPNRRRAVVPSTQRRSRGSLRGGRPTYCGTVMHRFRRGHRPIVVVSKDRHGGFGEPRRLRGGTCFRPLDVDP
ncbi:hypothetical protein B296_00030323 [Ensete ventricosum]|uniref:Uncharacterized protein n=1 Tax=Ensete ventricosum TaxID=4639 RepID=A0A426Z9I6_ENSVE|nr:hypothetical protein B296_00030323 [Ensete ventricosum]